MTTAIRAENLGKRYRIGQRERYVTLRDTLAGLPKASVRLFSRRRGHTRDSRPQHIWALRNASFQVQEGEVLGIIGRNGAGKTTLLKILARITEPTEGYAETRGRVDSLLEVGTGFHPELSGRENVYLSGAILGMSKREIDFRFDEIVGFAGLEIFMDTPLKHYSAGMHMRLAFAVAAHLEPDILLVDEVLAVGDLEFQKKCLGKMSEVAGGGRTVLFVSHQMNQIRRLCPRALWVDRGRIRASGPAGEIIGAYEASHADPREETGGRCFLRWEIPGQKNVIRDNFQEVTFRLTLNLREPLVGGHLGVAILNESNLRIAGWGFDGLDLPAGAQELTLRLASLPVQPGVYTLTCSLFNEGNNLTGGQFLEHWHAVPSLIVDTPPLTHPQDQWAGVLNIPAGLEVAGAAAAISGQPLDKN